MSKIKEYIMTLEDLVVEAYESGASTEEDIFAYVQDRLSASKEDVITLTKDLFMFVEDYHHGR
jgi:hypothetical protein